MHDLVIKMILDEYGIDNSENLSKALAKVLDEFSRDSRVATERVCERHWFHCHPVLCLLTNYALFRSVGNRKGCLALPILLELKTVLG